MTGALLPAAPDPARDLPEAGAQTAPIPAFVNPAAGSAADALRALAADGRFVVHEVPPERLSEAAGQAAAAGARRVLAAGGDGSVATVAAALAGTRTAMAVLPGGTLNHFAAHLGIPGDLSAALDVAATGVPRPVDVAYVNDQLFLNTSSVGAYIGYVRLRERLEPYLGYWPGSVVAGLRILFRLPRYRVEIEVEGVVREYLTPLVFVGVGERSLSPTGLGERLTDGRAGLHLIVLRRREAGRLFALWVAAARGGGSAVERMPDVDSFVVERCTVARPGGRVYVSIDGEVIRAVPPLVYRVAHGALSVIVPVGVTGA